jgi:hypothetical protein
MSKNTKRRWCSAFLFLSLIAGCSHKAPAASGAAPFQQALDYAKCMRANGVPDFPDPQAQGNGVQQDVGKNLDPAAVTKAQEACRDKMPQGEADDPDAGSVDTAKLASWTTCMRAKLPKFPDPQVSGNTVTVNLDGTGITSGSAEFEKVRQACDSHSPGGSIHVVDKQ